MLRRPRVDAGKVLLQFDFELICTKAVLPWLDGSSELAENCRNPLLAGWLSELAEDCFGCFVEEEKKGG